MTESNGEKLLTISRAPHIEDGESIPRIMWSVAAALVPAALFSIYLFGMKALILLSASTMAALTAEAATQVFFKKPVTLKDGSAVITGILVAMNIPPGAPVWVAVIGSIFAVIIVKQLFGGLGFNIFNPALGARAFLMASWPLHMTTGWHSFGEKNIFVRNIANTPGFPAELYDSITQATPLALLKEGPRIMTEFNTGAEEFYKFVFSWDVIKALFMGNAGGVIGETSVLMILIGALFLLMRKIITWHIPLSFIGSFAVMISAYYSLSPGIPSAPMAVLYHLFSGGLFLGAFFMATDMVTSPVTDRGMIVFGIGCGVITFTIRIWGGYPEGVSYAILLMNSVTPLIDRYMKPRVFGTKKVV